MTFEFWLTTLIIVASPGTGAIFTVATGLGGGARASVLAAWTCTFGIIPHLVAAIMGLTALLHTSAVLFEAAKYAGVAYLLWMAWQVLRDRGTMKIKVDATPRAALRVIRDGLALNLFNPKISMFFSAFLPQFIEPAAPDAFVSMLHMSAAFMAVTFVVFAIYGLFAAQMRDRILSNATVMTWIRRSFAAAFGSLAVTLALTDR